MAAQNPPFPGRSETLALVAELLKANRVGEARETLTSFYPFKNLERAKRQIPKAVMLQVFLRDGFVDRYDGMRLVFPGALHLMSCLLEDVFPYHPHGKYEKCHPAFWDVLASIDHIIPIARGGSNEIDNLVTVSMRTNARKANWLAEEAGLTLRPPGKLGDWDGLLGWFRETAPIYPTHVASRPSLRVWTSELRRFPG
jgi:5-methylcytosine-specific restriction endonuclease McrA